MNQHSVDMSRIETLAQHIFPSSSIQLERVEEAIFTTVYRVTRQNETFYLRLLPNADDSFASEVAIHTRLRQMQIKVPEVIYYEHYNEIVQRSVMVLAEIKGSPISQSCFLHEDKLQAIVMEAGQDLARFNMLAVDGFGPLRSRVSTQSLCALYPTLRAFALDGWDDALGKVANIVLSTEEGTMLERVLTHYDAWLGNEQSSLTHGDFSTRHIYQENGQYTGIIDFGDSQGASRWYDLGHFHMRDGGLLPYRFESALIHGYGEIVSLPSTYEQFIRFTSILINVRLLAWLLQMPAYDRSTLHLVDVLREDVATLQRFL